MSKTVKRIILSIIFILVLTAGLLLLYRVFSWKDTNGDYFSTFAELKTLPDDTVDVIAVGPSRTYNSFNPAILWEQEGIASFCMAVSGMDQKASYYHVKELLKTQSPKVVFMEASLIYNVGYGLVSNEYRNTIVAEPSKNNYDLITEVTDCEDTSDYLLRFPIIHSRYKELKKEDFVFSNNDKYRLGFNAGFSAAPQDIDESVFTDTVPAEPDEGTKAWIKKLINLSEEEGFTLIFYDCPTNENVGNYSKILGAFEYLNELGVKTIDFNLYKDELNFDDSTDFDDWNHLNDSGASKVSLWLASYLKDNFSLNDYRGDENHSRWDLCLKEYRHNVTGHQITNEDSAENSLELAHSLGDMLTVSAFTDSMTVTVNGETVLETTEAAPQYVYELDDGEYFLIKVDKENDSLKATVYFGSDGCVLEASKTGPVLLIYDMVTKTLYTKYF